MSKNDLGLLIYAILINIKMAFSISYSIWTLHLIDTVLRKTECCAISFKTNSFSPNLSKLKIIKLSFIKFTEASRHGFLGMCSDNLRAFSFNKESFITWNFHRQKQNASEYRGKMIGAECWFARFTFANWVWSLPCAIIDYNFAHLDMIRILPV